MVLQKAADYNKQPVDFLAARFEAELQTDDSESKNQVSEEKDVDNINLT